MKHRRSLLGMLVLALSVVSCKSAPEAPVQTANTVADAPIAESVDNVGDGASMPMFDPSPIVVDLSNADEKTVTPFTQGGDRIHLADILPVVSDSSGYVQKWEFYLYSEPYAARLKFEISNFAFSKNELKIKGYVQEHNAAGDTVQEYKISKTYKSGKWFADKNNLILDCNGDYTLKLEDGVFKLHGVYEKGSFDYAIEPNFWKPGSGNVYFGKDASDVFKYSVLAYHKPLVSGVVTLDGQTIPVNGTAYANHYMTNIAAYEMFDELADFRKIVNDHVLVEFRYYLPTSRYEYKPFGYLFVAYDGVPVFSSTSLTRESLETWMDDEHYNYEIDLRQRLSAEEDGNKATFTMHKGRATGSDPYADLPSFQRAVAMRFAKPIEYNIKIDWTLDLDIDGYKATIPYSGAYSLTRMH